MNRQYTLLLFVWILPLLFGSVQAQSTGKISGTITEAGTGDPLPGVSVYIPDSQIGAITDTDGKYVILGVPPGDYTLLASFVGFATVRTEAVQVFSGRTTTIDVVLAEEVIQNEEVVVTADRPIVIRDRTTSVSFVDQETIDRLPVTEVSDLIKFQPGVVSSSSGGFHFRGGREREAAYLIDGVPVEDVFSQNGGSTVDIEVQSVQELQVFTGTFDAEFGGAQSGIVNVTTRSPGTTLGGQVRFQSGGYYAGSDDLFVGGDSFDPIETKELSITLNGPIAGQKLGFFLSGRYVDEVGYLRGRRVFTSDDGFAIDTYRRWYRDLYDPEDTRLISLDAARTPAGEPILDRAGNQITFASGDGAVVDMDWSTSITVNPKLVFRPFGRTQFTLASIFNRSEGQGYNDARRFAPDDRAVYHRQSLLNILTFKQTIGNNMILAVRGSYKIGLDETYAFQSINDPGIRIFGASDDVTGFSLGRTDNDESRVEEEQFTGSADFTWQVNESNEFKAGVQLRSSNLVIEDLDRDLAYADNPDSLFQNLSYPSASQYPFFEDYLAEVQNRLPILVPELSQYAVNDRFDQTPIEFAVFAQDKLEFDSRLVVKAGLRFEYFDLRAQTVVDERAKTDVIGRPENLIDATAKSYLSPRIGISYPISSTGAFRVAYGHFVQMPAYREMLKNPIFSEINVGLLEGRVVGNPNLEPERTIKYEMGLQQQLNEFLGVDVNLFYKNIRNLLGTEILSTTDNIQYQRTVNRDYGLVRGATLSIVTRPIGWLLNTSFDVTYSDAQGSSSNPDDVANIAIVGRSGEVGEFFLERNIIPLNWDQPLTLNLVATVGRANDWNVGFITQYASGQPYTPAFLDPNKDFPDNTFDNAERKPTIFRFDMSAEKSLTVGAAAVSLRLQVENVFNHLNELTVNNISGRAGQIVRLPVVQDDRELVMDYVGLFNSNDADLTPTWYSAPRLIRLGVTVSF